MFEGEQISSEEKGWHVGDPLRPMSANSGVCSLGIINEVDPLAESGLKRMLDG